MQELVKIERALVSVTDKTDLDYIGGFLAEHGVEIIASGGTQKKLREYGIPAIEISQYTGSPEVLGGRVKTLHPKTFAGILAPTKEELASLYFCGTCKEVYKAPGICETDSVELTKYDAPPIDMVVVNLYKFQDTLAKGGSEEDLVEHIDIGGPSLVRASAKNKNRVAIVTNPTQYERLVDEMKENSMALSRKTRFDLACDAYNLTADYDAAIANWHETLRTQAGQMPKNLHLVLRQALSMVPEARERGEPLNLKYGENPGLAAIAYQMVGYDFGILSWKQMAGSSPSFNNLREGGLTHNILRRLSERFDIPISVTAKHGIISGIGGDVKGIEYAYYRDHSCDPWADLGNVAMFNRPCTEQAAQLVGLPPKGVKQIEFCGEMLPKTWPAMTEVFGAPDFGEGTVELFREKQSKEHKMKVFKTGQYSSFEWDLRGAYDGMMLMQSPPHKRQFQPHFELMAGEEVDELTLQKLGVGVEVVYAIPSNGAVILDAGFKNGHVSYFETYGIGTSTRRNRATEMAVSNALRFSSSKLEYAVCVEDGFLPKPDSLVEIARSGIKVVAMPRGSSSGVPFGKGTTWEQDVIDEAEKRGISLYVIYDEAQKNEKGEMAGLRLFAHP